MRCFICNEKIKGLGNNGLPITTMTVCDECNKGYIIPIRLFYSLDKFILLLKDDFSLELIRITEEALNCIC